MRKVLKVFCPEAFLCIADKRYRVAAEVNSIILVVCDDFNHVWVKDNICVRFFFDQSCDLGVLIKVLGKFFNNSRVNQRFVALDIDYEIKMGFCSLRIFREGFGAAFCTGAVFSGSHNDLCAHL